jgi:pectinesterase
LWIIGLSGVLIVLPLVGYAQSEADGRIVRVENPSATSRSTEVVSVAWSDVESVPGQGEQVRVRDRATGEEVPTQVLDANGDGTPEELLFLAGFRGGEERHFEVRPAASNSSVEAHVDAFHQEERDDIAWENRQVAFRTYGEGLREIEEDFSSSGIDVWMKRVSELVIEDWYA